MQDESTQDLEKTNDDDNGSVISVDITEGTGYSTTWGPVGFSRIHHAFAIMVSYPLGPLHVTVDANELAC